MRGREGGGEIFISLSLSRFCFPSFILLLMNGKVMCSSCSLKMFQFSTHKLPFQCQLHGFWKGCCFDITFVLVVLFLYFIFSFYFLKMVLILIDF